MTETCCLLAHCEKRIVWFTENKVVEGICVIVQYTQLPNSDRGSMASLLPTQVLSWAGGHAPLVQSRRIFGKFDVTLENFWTFAVDMDKDKGEETCFSEKAICLALKCSEIRKPFEDELQTG